MVGIGAWSGVVGAERCDARTVVETWMGSSAT